MVRNLPAMQDSLGLIPGSGKSPGGGNSYALQYSCLENSVDRGAWRTSLRSRRESDMTEQLTPLLLVSLRGFLELDVTREWVATPAILMERQGMVWRERITNTTEKRQRKAACERGGEGGSALSVVLPGLSPVPRETRLLFLLWGSVRYPHLPKITSTSPFSKEIICIVLGNS